MITVFRFGQVVQYGVFSLILIRIRMTKVYICAITPRRHLAGCNSLCDSFIQ